MQEGDDDDDENEEVQEVGRMSRSPRSKSAPSCDETVPNSSRVGFDFSKDFSD